MDVVDEIRVKARPVTATTVASGNAVHTSLASTEFGALLVGDAEEADGPGSETLDVDAGVEHELRRRAAHVATAKAAVSRIFIEFPLAECEVPRPDWSST
jgi:hypothetical protein